MAHVCPRPAAMAWTFEPNPATWTGTELSVVELFPNCPLELYPQHQTEPLTNAHECSAPEVIAWALVLSDIATGRLTP